MNIIGKVLLNRYRVDAFIASGGMGVVYRVWDLERNVPLAMKVLNADLVDDPSVIKHFIREARALEKLAHPHIVPFYGMEQTDEFTFLLERFVDGASLKDILRQRHNQPLSISEALIYLKALCTALGYAHNKGVVHCDVKPGNVMIDGGGNIYLTDFGVVRHAESTTTTMGSAGTPAYMAPEQIRGEPVSAATDVYALGILLFEMLTGQRPFVGSDSDSESSGATAAERVRVAHLTQIPPKPSEINPEICKELDQVVLAALAKNPSERYQFTQNMLENACAALGVTIEEIPERVASLEMEPNDFGARKITPGKTVISTPRARLLPQREIPVARPRRSWLVIAVPLLVVLFLILAVVGGLAYFGTQGKGPLVFLAPLKPTTTSTSLSIQTTPTSEEAVGGNITIITNIPSPTQPTTEIPSSPTPAETVPPTSSSLVIGGADKVAYLNGNDVWVANLDGSELTQLTEDRTTKKNLQWTPDGQAVNYISGKCIYSVYLEDKRKEQVTCFNFTDYLKSFEISSDGKHIALSLDNELYILPNDLNIIRSVSVKKDLTKIAECKEFAPLPDKMVKFNRWSKDSQKLAVVMNQVVRGLGSAEAIQVFPVNQCTAKPHALVNFPNDYFQPEEYKARSELPNFGWDGFDLIAFATYIRNEGFGNLYVYNIDLKKPVKPINPVDGKGYYRDPVWSPDGSHLMFAFQQWPGEDSTIKLYYIPYGTLGTGVIYTPILLPPIDPKTKPQPALRPVP